MNIISGKQIVPVKGIIYGVEGIGKTTFASHWPSPLLMDVERGSSQMDVQRVIPETYAEVKSCINELLQENHSFNTLVIDSADFLEQLMIRHICTEANINCIEKYEKGYGRGWHRLIQEWGALLDRLDFLRHKKNMNILFVAHAKIKHYEPADDAGYDRYTLIMCHDKSADLLKKWSDLTLFAKYDTFTVEENGKIKVQGGNKRVMYSSFHPCWDAKNRYGLPEKMEFSFDQIRKIFSMRPGPVVNEAAIPPPEAPPVEKAPPVTVKETVPGQVPPMTAETPAAPPAVKEDREIHRYSPDDCKSPEEVANAEKEMLLNQLDSLLQGSGCGYAELCAEVERRGVVPKGTEIRAYNTTTLNRIIASWDKIHKNILLAKNTKG